ncbi:conserved hypothetical protein [Pyrenophora tritici-repentis Pt-1C-BFP]|uniref:Uncharacterized protein n=1 Tax=Pyrenophora tritici-repentis (strain Pt-1C-BFP) TaxID=426418 RepID=B2WH49_PYRTR|nr:uncharacterized protein PTRG_09308 [Pyrenophora tritici-repentis Pt-1C-BFP]EDU42359.1 conserved hypothetical protein [Pyrenophora tritici-repentis Pt-1C-BFP]
MHLTTLLALLPLLTPLALAAPPTAPRISRLVFSGSGCPSSSSSVTSTSATLGDTAGVTFSQLRGSNTDNCAVHVQSTGASAGWQVAVRGVTYEGDVVLKGASGLDTYTQVFWSDRASDTWSKCTGADGDPGILNINFRPIVQGNYGSYDFKSAVWKLEWRTC